MGAGGRFLVRSLIAGVGDAELQVPDESFWWCLGEAESTRQVGPWVWAQAWAAGAA